MLKHRRLGSRRAAGQRGLSLVEMLVGVAVGMFLIAGAATLFVANLGSSRKMLVEARLNQDLRAAADLVSRDLRRAGYWARSIDGTISQGASAATVANPYSAVAASGTQVTYAFSRAASGGAENNVVDANEDFGYQLGSSGGVGTLEMRLSTGNWQTVTDPAAVNVTQFIITPVETPIQIGSYCAVPCSASAPCANPPVLTIRQYDILLVGIAATDPAVERRLQTRTRLRNDRLTGSCS
jgi:prepilin peptidase dependent protein B